MAIQVTTPSPDEDQPVLNNGVEDEITADREAAVGNYGTVRYQIRETGQSSWDSNAIGFAEQTVQPDTLSVTFGGLEDGEAYEVRGRTETEHVTGAWTTPVSIVTAFPTPANVTASADGPLQVTLTWDDQADNEDGFTVERRRTYADGTVSNYTALDTLAPNSEQYVDDTVSPTADYEFRVTAFTEDVSVSATDTVTTPSLADARPLGGSWTVEIDHPNRDQPLRPTPLDGVEFRPTLNGLPQISIPIRQDDRWDGSNFETAPMRVWFRGTRVPIDRLISVEQTPGQTVLVGRGGQQLKNRVTREVQQQESHLLVEDIIQSDTSYIANVDDPSSAVSEDLLQSVNDETDWRNALSTVPSTLPLEGGGGGSLFSLQSLVFREAENADVSSNLGATQTGGQFNGSEAVALQASGANVGFNINFDYALPDDNVGVRLLFRYPGPDQSNPEVTVTLANSQLGLISSNALLQDGSPEWYAINVTAGDVPFTTWPDSSRQLDVEITQSTGEPIYLDSIAVFDDRYNYDFATATNGSAPGPELYPDEIRTQTQLVNSAFGLTSARLASSWDNTSNKQEVAVRAGSQTAWTTASNSTGVQTSFTSNKTAVQARFTLSRYSDGRSTTPTQGNQGQSVDSYDLFADVDQTPLVINETFDGQPVDILNTVADRGDFIWELTYDDSAGSLAVEFTKPGQRSTGRTSPPSDYQASKSTADQVDEVIIRGGGQSIQDEEITADHGTFVPLQENNLIQGPTVVRDATSGTTYDEGQDYVVRRLAGAIKTLSSGAIGNGDTLEVDYQFKVIGKYQSPDYDPATDQSQVFDLPGLPTAAAAEQTALFLHRQISVPQYAVSVDLSREPADRSLVAAREFDAVPSGGRKKVVDTTETPTGTRVQLANRRGVSETVSRLRDRVEQISERV